MNHTHKNILIVVLMVIVVVLLAFTFIPQLQGWHSVAFLRVKGNQAEAACWGRGTHLVKSNRGGYWDCVDDKTGEIYWGL